MIFKEILDMMIEKDASDIFIRANGNIKGRVYSQIVTIDDTAISSDNVNKIIDKITRETDKERLRSQKGCEFTYWYKDFWRFRVGVFYQRGTPSLVVRKIDLRIPSFEELSLPPELLTKFCKERRGIIFLTGITGSGKSTTIASMIDYINNNFGRHIVTIEEPIEFTFEDKKSIINQREIGTDVWSYKDALKQFALHSPDVVYIGNIRDAETCHAALTIAQTGVLVFSTLHTVNAASTVERIINFFPSHQHNFVLNQLSFLLKGVFSQRLIPRCDRAGLVPAYESMVLSPSVSRLIRENKLWEIPKYIDSGDIYGMVSFQKSLLGLVESGKVSFENALAYADRKDELEMELRSRGKIQSQDEDL
ncbi:MAG: PilT/PilU family type 4a pilus ATPase [Candidatus Omnitrophica bacterium]|nr:PilT/PilU family type 4a pilus ATPase [Candidatus Omnitrophota bacterium]